MGEQKRRAAASNKGLPPNLPCIIPIDALRPEFFDDPRFRGAPMLTLMEALEDLMSGSDEQSPRAFKQTIDTPAGPLAVMIIYPKPVESGR